ncbi:MAG: hypothetical protein KKF65_00970 [Nanoarchaeota archaeon]|nr:hypothetical protein [Nanoarchaeota archaeon]
MLFFLIKLVFAFPPLSTEFYGNVTAYNNPIPSGAIVRVFSADNTLCGLFTVINSGHFGLLSCLVDDSSTVEKEGPVNGGQVYFTVDGQIASLFGSNTSSSGDFKFIELVIPKIRCGDNFCDLKETCASCPSDCGLCQTTPPGTIGVSPTSSSSGGSGGGGGGSGSSSTGGFPSVFPTGYQFPQVSIQGLEMYFTCEESWVCGNWSKCPPTEIMSRSCTDQNHCGTYRNKPVEKKACVYNLEKLKDELKKNEEITKPPRRETPLDISFPRIVCDKETNPLKNGAIWFFLLVVLVIAYSVYRNEKQIESIRKKKGIDDVQKAKLILATKRKTHIFMGVMIFFTIVLYLFYVFFFLCDINFTALWILVAVMLLLPLIVHKVIDFLEYHEQQKIIKLEELADTHYKQISELINIESSNIADIEKDLAEKLSDLSSRESFKIILKRFPYLEQIYLDIIRLYEEYESKKLLFADETVLVDDIYELANKDEFIELSEKSPALKSVYEKLLLLYKHYEEKQELYDELAKAEEEIRKRLRDTDEMNKSNKDNKNNK